jgi:hypothetical protein
LLAGLGAFVGIGTGTAEASPVNGVLSAGQSWTNTALAQSPSGEFSLYIHAYGLSLDQSIDLGRSGVGTEVWSSPRVAGHCLNPQLTMRPGGAAVLHCGDHQLWATPTWGTGSGNSLRIRDDGMLVIRTKSGRVVWSSHSGPSLLVTGQRLAPGHWLRNCPTFGPCTSLTMRRNGDVALTFGRRLDWHTDTHRPGSSLVFRRSGALQVVGPLGRALWRSHTGGIGAAYLMVNTNAAGNRGRIDMSAMQHPKFGWYRE